MNTPEEMSQIEHIRFRASMYIGRVGDGTYPHDGYIHCCEKFYIT